MKTKLLAALLLFAVPACGQEIKPKVPRFKIFVGVSGSHFGDTNLHLLATSSFYGGQGEFSVNLTPRLGIVVDGGVQRQPIVGFIQYQVQALAGLQFTFHPRIVNPFVHVLGGYVQQGVGPYLVEPINQKFPGVHQGGEALMAGGGLDWNLGHHLALRIPQLDYIPEDYHAFWVKNSYRAGVGVLVYFGRVR